MGLCRLAGVSRQAYYKEKHQRQWKAIEKEKILQEVHLIRQSMPRSGVRKVLAEIRLTWGESAFDIGRDRFFDLMREKKLLVKPKKRWIKTTWSQHNLPLFRNLLKERHPTAPHQVWVADITHIRLNQGWLYLSLVTDLFSRKIVGWNLSKSLHASHSLTALHMAISQLPPNRFPIHHSDRGCQYCCHEYTSALFQRGLSVSMTEENHCYENAVAERLNGILKGEFNLDATFQTALQAHTATEQAIHAYNHLRAHLSLNMRKPAQVQSMAA